MTLGNVARVLGLLGALAAAAGSASSTSQNNPSMIAPQGGSQYGAPPPQQMEPSRALGLWHSTFGAVKIEPDNRAGGIQAGAVQGAWTYERQQQQVVGLFWGNLRGNVLQFRWQEDGTQPLTGEGYLVFDQQGRQYSGRWWTDRRDRTGDWNGWRQTPGQPQPDPYNRGAYGGQGYGDPYGGQGGAYGGQPYGGGYPQPQPPTDPYARPSQPDPYGRQPQPQPQPQPRYY